MVRVGDSGAVEYTGRAFNQDAQEAMGGDIARALIELITNADDAYVAGGDSGVGKIGVLVDRSRGREWAAAVRDRAVGIAAVDMIEKITRLGGRTSGFERGEDRRGNLGRGAKDVAAFGDVTFESIKDGRYARLLLRSDGSYTLQASSKATDPERNDLGIPRANGTVVTIRVKAGTKCPLHATLKTKLSAHYQLRDILSDPKRRVELEAVNSGVRDPLVYQYPDLPVAFDGDLAIDGYPEAAVHLTIWRHPIRYDESRDDPTRLTGILVKGRRAIYDNTLFGYEGNPHAGWFSGRLVCEFIDQLANEFDDRASVNQLPDPRNALRIISRRREGLTSAHPFVKALRSAAEIPLGTLVAEEADRARREGSRLEDDQSRAALDRLSREMSQLINDELREIEAEEHGDADAGSVPAIAIVPEVAYAYLGEDRTLTIQVRNDVAAAGESADVSVDPAGILELLNPSVVLSAHARRQDLLVGQIRLRPLVDSDSTLVTATINDHAADAIVEVRGERLVLDEPVIEPEALEFDRTNYRLSVHREKTIQLRAPAALIATNGRQVTVSSSLPGVVVRTPTIDMRLDEEVDFYKAAVRIEGRVLGVTSALTAILGDVSASAHVTVVRKEEGLNFRIRLVDEDMGVYRAVAEQEIDPDSGLEVRVLKVSGRYPGLRPHLVAPASVNSREARLVIAEAVADVAARLVVNQLYRLRRGSEEFTSERLYLEHYKRFSRFLPRAQGALLADLDVPSGILASGLGSAASAS